MADWMDELLDTMSKGDQNQTLAQQVQLHRANVIEAKARDFIDGLNDAAMTIEARFNEKFAGKLTILVERWPDGFTLSKKTYPDFVTMHCSVESAAQVVRVTVTRTGSPRAQQTTKQTLWTIDTDQADNLIVRHDDQEYAHMEHFADVLIRDAIVGS